MFEKMRTFFGRVCDLFTYGRTLSQIRKWWSSYPGLSDSSVLRAWLRPVIVELTELASKTSVQFDDRIADALLRFLDNDHLWNILYESIQIMMESFPNKKTDELMEIVEIPVDSSHQLVHAARLVRPENPLLVISAAGLLLQIVQLAHRYRQSHSHTCGGTVQ